MPVIAGAIFAGGQSRRMGQLKEGVRLWDNRPMLEHVADAFRWINQPVIIVGQCSGYALNGNFPYVRLMDEQPGLGPAFALKTLLASGLATHYLIGSCDQPLLEPDLLQRLTAEIPSHPEQAIFFQNNDETTFDPFPGVYPASLLSQVEQSIQQGQSAMRKLFGDESIHWVYLPEGMEFRLSNCNTPADVEAVNQLLSGQKSQPQIQAQRVSS